MQLCIFGSKVCQLVFVRKSASRHTLGVPGMGLIQTYGKKSKQIWVGLHLYGVQLGAYSVPTLTTVFTVSSLFID